ncbi:MAG: ABC transporter permease [Spirochaetota bacterium]
MFLFFVAIIIIVNTLSMSAIERSSEIGMMRAIGAHKSFVSAMFLGETSILSLVFGGAGMIVGIIAVNVIPLIGITSANDFVQLIYGGDTFMPYLSAFDILLVFGQLLLVTLITVIYPVKVAGNITPLDAVSRD